jgi:hypothetical protein
MLSELKERSVLPADLSQTLERIRDSTYYSEWREGAPPDLSAIKFVSQNAPDAINKLMLLKEKVTSQTGPEVQSK